MQNPTSMRSTALPHAPASTRVSAVLRPRVQQPYSLCADGRQSEASTSCCASPQHSISLSSALRQGQPAHQSVPGRTHRKQPLLSTTSLSRHITSSALATGAPSVNFLNILKPSANYTVVKAQVAFFGDIRKFQRALDRLAGEYNARDESSLHRIMTKAAELVGRNVEYAGYASTAGKAFRDLGDCEDKFQAVSLDERTKYKEETLVNTKARQRQKALSTRGMFDPQQGLDQWICVTLLGAIDGPSRLPKRIENTSDLRKAMATFASIEPEELLAFELIWTPQDEGDSYSRNELLADYPSLTSL